MEMSCCCYVISSTGAVMCDRFHVVWTVVIFCVSLLVFDLHCCGVLFPIVRICKTLLLWEYLCRARLGLNNSPGLLLTLAQFCGSFRGINDGYKLTGSSRGLSA